MRFDSVVFADTAPLAALSCLARLRAERDAGRETLIVSLGDTSGAGAIEARRLAVVKTFDALEAEAGAEVRPALQPWRERLVLIVRRLDPKHILAPLGLLGASRALDYFTTLRSALSVDRGRDLLFFEERPHALVPEALPLRLAEKGVRLPPATRLRSPRRYAPFALRVLSGFGTPPIFGGLRARWRLIRDLRPAFREARDWDPQRALGPKAQPVLVPWDEEDAAELFALAAELGKEEGLQSPKSFRRRMQRHAGSAASRSRVERYWLSLPPAGEAEATGEFY